MLAVLETLLYSTVCTTTDVTVKNVISVISVVSVVTCEGSVLLYDSY